MPEGSGCEEESAQRPACVASAGSTAESVFVPVTVPVGDSIVKSASSVRIWPAAITSEGLGPEMNPSKNGGSGKGDVAGPIVTSIVSVNVPGYGPTAMPLNASE